MIPVNYLELASVCGPQIIVVLTALIVLVADAAALRDAEARTRSTLLAALGCAGLGIALVWALAVQPSLNFQSGVLLADPLTRFVHATLLVMGIGACLSAVPRGFTSHAGEFFALLLLSISGLMFMASSENLLVIFTSLELASLSLYVLAALDKTRRASPEAGLKYFLFGGVSAAFLLFGLSWIYGLTGAIDLRLMMTNLPSPEHPLFLIGCGFVVAGLGFKIAAAPFHWWAPETYQAAPAPAAALIASGSKVAAFVVLARVATLAPGSSGWPWLPMVALVAGGSMVLGNLGALAQGNFRKLLAYSAIAHSGYLLLGVLAGEVPGWSALLYYLATYGLASVGLFAIIEAIESEPGTGRLNDFEGLSRRSPLLAACLLILLLSLAGIPPLAGFFAKFYIFTAALKAGPSSWMLPLVVLAVATSAVSLYYYLRVLKAAFVRHPIEVAPLRVPASLMIIVVAISLLTVVLGCLPQPLLNAAARAAATLLP
jgi:NADH-quinone oxidoreductase subunit N